MKKKREPFIGITCDVKVPDDKIKEYELICDHRYPEAVKGAGGYPVLLPIAQKKGIIARYLDGIDGLIIVGGGDVDPKLYGEKPRRGTKIEFPLRLKFERKIYLGARRRKLPVFGICYGMQFINVLEGGTLFQDITRDARSPMKHDNKKKPYHHVNLLSGSYLRKVVGRDRISVHSEHHQAVAKVAPGFTAVALSKDGIIEAIESKQKQIFAVQWHPERTLISPSTKRLFREFVKQC